MNDFSISSQVDFGGFVGREAMTAPESGEISSLSLEAGSPLPILKRLIQLFLKARTMINSTSTFIKFLLSLVLITAFSEGSYADIVLPSGDFAVERDFETENANGRFLGATATFNLCGVDPQDIELLANFSIVDAGVEIRVNGTSLFQDFFDVSEFSQDLIFSNTGVQRQVDGGGFGNIENPFTANNNSGGLPRLTVSSSSAGTTFSGAPTISATSVIEYTPTFQTQDFTSLLNSGDNTIEIFVLNNFEDANLVGDFAITQVVTTAVPEPSSAGLLLLASTMVLLRRRR